MKKRFLSFVVEIVAALLLGGCGVQETAPAPNTVDTVIEQETEVPKDDSIENKIYQSPSLASKNKQDVIDFCTMMIESDNPQLLEVVSLINSYPELLDDAMSIYVDEISSLGLNLSEITDAYAALTGYTGLNTVDLIDPRFSVLPENSYVTIDIGSLKFICEDNNCFIYEANEVVNGVYTNNIIEINSLYPLEKTVDYSKSETMNCMVLTTYYDVIDGFQTKVTSVLFGDDLTTRNQTNDFIFYVATSRNAKIVLQDVIDYLEGREPLNADFVTVYEVAAELDLEYLPADAEP